MRDLLRRLLTTRAFPAVVVLLGVALTFPSLGVGFVVDDYIHHLMLRGESVGLEGVVGGWQRLFVFIDGTPETHQALIELGCLPWWSDPELRLAFWRPLSALTHLLDLQLWPGNAFAAHAHNLVWMALGMVAAAWIYRRFIPSLLWANVALLVLAIDDARGPTISWVANRNALICLFFALMVLGFHDRWRRDGWGAGQVLALGCLVLSLFAGEGGVAIGAYLFAYALFLDTGPISKRIGALLPYAGVVAVWQAAYRHLGFGAENSGLYVEPVRDAPEFLVAVATYLPVLLAGAWGVPWADFWPLYPIPWLPTVWALAVFVVVLVTLLCWSACRSADSDEQRNQIGFWFCATTLCVVPVCATFPADRLLSFAIVGSAGLFSTLLATWGQGRAWRRVLLVLGVAIHVPLAGLLAPIRATTMQTVGEVMQRSHDSISDAASIEAKTLVFMGSPSEATVSWLHFERESKGIPRPKALRYLVNNFEGVTYERVDSRTLLMSSPLGVGALSQERMTRGGPDGLEVGTEVVMRDLRVEVEAVNDDGWPTRVRFTFDADLEDEKWVWLRWEYGEWVPYTPPSLGEAQTLGPADDWAQYRWDAKSWPTDTN